MAAVEVVASTLATALSGNAITAERYVKVFAELGHTSKTVGHPSGEADVVVALNAYRSARAIESAAVGRSLVVVVLTGTDIYRFLPSDPDVVLGALTRADRIVGLNDRIGDDLEPRHRARLDIIYEGAAQSVVARDGASTEFAVAVVGHLRDEKDPCTVAAAVRDLPEHSRIVVNHYGAAHTEEWAVWARAEVSANERYRWHGEVPRERIASVYSRSCVLVNSSIMEGGANAISEAVMAYVPILASDIPGNVGVLGETYPGYFPVGDASTLRQALLGMEQRPDRVAELETAVIGLQQRLNLAVERRGWSALFAKLGVR
jgi:putative glycosyltransferase (TIGR04348 family)